MYLQCPRCNSLFEMTPEALGAKGRKVNCAVCANIWTAKASNLLKKMPAATKDGNIEPQTNVAPPHHAHSPAPPQASVPSAQQQARGRQAGRQGRREKIAEQQGAIPSPQAASSQQRQRPQSAEEVMHAHMHAHTRHLHFPHMQFRPLQFAERRLERRISELIRFTISWLIWSGFIFAAAYVVRTYPIDIIAKFPNAIHLYERLNMMHPAFIKLMLQPNAYSIGKVGVTSEFRLSRDVLLITTFVTNETQGALVPPILRGSFRNSIDEEISYFHYRAIDEEIPPKQAIEYRISVEKPEQTSETLHITPLSDFEASLDLGKNRLDARTAQKAQKPTPATVNEEQTPAIVDEEQTPQ